MEFFECKSILSKYKNTDYYLYRDYNMNLYRGCNQNCIYCDSRSLCYQIKDFGIVRAKKDALNILEKELKSKRKKGIIGTGATSDPYNSYEKDLELTREALKLVDKYGFGISITTKSPLIVRDIDILQNIAKHSPCDIRFTITAYDDALCRKIERNAKESSKRFEALKQLSHAGLYTGVFITPVLPYITDNIENIVQIVDKSKECGAKNIICFMGMTLREGNREYYYKYLDKAFPGLKEQYIKEYGNKYICNSKNAKELYTAFTSACNRNGIIYNMKEINSEIQKLYKNDQLSFL